MAFNQIIPEFISVLAAREWLAKNVKTHSRGAAIQFSVTLHL